MTLKFDIDITGLPNTIIQRIQNELKLKFAQSGDILFLNEIEKDGGEIKERSYKDEYNMKRNSANPEVEVRMKRRTIGFRFKKTVTANIFPDIFLTPF